MRMRAQAVFRPAKSLLLKRAANQRTSFHCSNGANYPRRDSEPTCPGRTLKRSSSYSTPAVVDQDFVQELAQGGSPPPPPPEEPSESTENTKAWEGEKVVVKRTKRPSKAAEVEKEDSPSLPTDLNILWAPDSQLDDDNRSLTALPPPEVFHDALTNLVITLHPQTQHRAAYSSQGNGLTEPTLALYCPIEGGDYVVDETVRELARRTYSDVVVLDAVHLAAGEWGAFGKGS